jgi:hypothetical protein
MLGLFAPCNDTAYLQTHNREGLCQRLQSCEYWGILG